MPMFKVKGTGLDVWVPKARLLFMEPGPGALTTVVTMVAVPGGPSPVQQFEAEETVTTNVFNNQLDETATVGPPPERLP